MILPTNFFLVLVFPLSTKRSQTIEFELKDNLTIQAWSKIQNTLAVGTAKGSLILVDFKTDQKLPILGKHGKKITQLVWSKSNLIGVGSIDGAITINNDHGDTIHAQKLRSEPIALKFGAMKSDTKVHEEDTISCLLEQEQSCKILSKEIVDIENKLCCDCDASKNKSCCEIVIHNITILF